MHCLEINDDLKTNMRENCGKVAVSVKLLQPENTVFQM
jgi:hypothetical protein